MKIEKRMRIDLGRCHTVFNEGDVLSVEYTKNGCSHRAEIRTAPLSVTLKGRVSYSAQTAKAEDVKLSLFGRNVTVE